MKFNSVLNGVKSYAAGKPIELVVREFGIAPKDIIKLASNENPRGCSLGVQEALSKNLHLASLYPDDSMFELKEGLAKRFNVSKDNIIIGAGSDQVIEFAIHAKTDATKSILMAGITFAMYEIYSMQLGVKSLKTTTSTHNLDEFRQMYQKHKEKISIIFLCLPNNPLGECLDTSEVYKFLEEIDEDVLVVVDGAYQEYASFKDEAKKIYPDDLIAKFPNTLYLGTFSKAYGLGGLRCGYGIANEEIIKTLHKLRPPFNITSLTLKGSIEALKDEEFVQKCLKENFEQMSRYEAFAKEKGINFIDSYTNFITLELPKGKNSSKISDLLLKKGIIVRDLASYGINSIRITIGTPNQNDRVLEELQNIYM